MIENRSVHRWLAPLSVLAVMLAVLIQPATRAAAANAALPAPPAAASIQVSPGIVGAGTSMTVTGQGFAPGTTVTVTVDVRVQNANQTVETSALVSSAGTFSAAIAIPASTDRGDYTVAARGTPGNAATHGFRVRPRIVMQAGHQTSLTIDAGHGFYAMGAGFQAGETVIFSAVVNRYGLGPMTVRQSAVADTYGNTHDVFIALPPRAISGNVSFTARGQQSKRQASMVLTIARHPVISLNPATVSPGGTVTVSGAGFVPESAIEVALTLTLTNGMQTTVTMTVTPNGVGDFSKSLVVPGNARAGAYAITATDNTGGFRAQQTVQVANHSSIAVQPTSAYPGSSVTVTGSYFEGNVQVVVTASFPLLGGGTQSTSRTVVTNENGTFSLAFLVPAGAAAGPVTVTARGPQTHPRALLTVVRLHATMTVTPSPVTPGNRVTISGAGFGAGVSVAVTAVVPLYGGGSQTLSTTVQTNGQGQYAASLLIPRNAGSGPVTITARGPRSQQRVVLKVGPVGSTISASPASLRPGSSVTISGSGYSAGAHIDISIPIHLQNGAAQTLTWVTVANGNGQFSVAVPLPADIAAGTYTISVRSASSGRVRTAQISITRETPTLSVQPSSSLPGGAVTVTAAHFSPGVSVTVSASFPLAGGGSQPVTRTVQTNATGSFSLSFPVPVGAAARAVTVVAHGPHSQTSARLSVSRLNATMTITPNTITPGQTVMIAGSGFSAGVSVVVSAVVPLYGGGSRTISTTVRTNGQGQYSAQLTIPRNAASGPVSFTARGPRTQHSASAQVGQVASRITVSPPSTVPGGHVAINGFGYAPGARVEITLSVKTRTGATQAVPVTATANANGAFSVPVRLPAAAVAGTYTIQAKSVASGRVRTAQITVAQLTPSIVAVPTTGAPGTPLTINGFGFAPGITVTLTIGGQRLGVATTNGNGQFSVQAAIPTGLGSGTYQITGTSSTGRTTTIGLTVKRQVSTHFYFASLYTGNGYHEYLGFLNSTATPARVQISYQPTVGAPRTKTITINPHSRYTEDVNADVGVHVSTAAAIAADVAISAERFVYHGSDGTIVPGTTSPATTWYFANGNTSHGYREFIAVQNPGLGPVDVTLHILPTHSRPLTISRQLGATARTTFKINSYIKDAVGVTVTANGPIVANQTIYKMHGMTSKIGLKTPSKHWYIAAGPRDATAHNWIAVVNTSNRWSYVTLHAYGPSGTERGTTHAWLRPFARKGYLMNHIANGPDVAVVVTSTQPGVVEQTTYRGRFHDASTDNFAVPAPAKNWQFAVANTWSGQDAQLKLFNPSLSPIGIAVQYLNTAGNVIQRAYVVAPLSHQFIDLAEVMPNQQFGIVAASNQPFVALARQTLAGGLGAMTSTGFHS